MASPTAKGQPTPEGTTLMTKLSYSVKEAAQMIGCSPERIRSLIASHELPAFTLSDKPKAKRYISHADLVAYIDFCRDTNAA